MPEIDFFFDEEDERSLIANILNQGGWLVASGQKTSTYERIETWDAYQAARFGGGQKWALENERLFFVLFDCYNECPLELLVTKGGYYKGTYSVSQRVGGPTLDLFLCKVYEKEGINVSTGGNISYYPSYKNTTTGEMERAPKALIERYKELASLIRKQSKLIKCETSGRKYYIGPHTYERMKAGELHFGVKGLSLDENAPRPKPVAKKVLVPFDPYQGQPLMGDFLVPIKDNKGLQGIKSHALTLLGIVVMSEAADEDDLVIELLEFGPNVKSADEMREYLGRYLQEIQSYEIGNIVCLRNEPSDTRLQLVSSTPTEFMKQFNVCRCNKCQ